MYVSEPIGHLDLQRLAVLLSELELAMWLVVLALALERFALLLHLQFFARHVALYLR